MSKLETFLARVPGVKRSGKDSYRAPCPAHLGKNPNLKITETSDGRILLMCHSRGCSAEEIVNAVGLQLSDIMPDDPTFHRSKPLRIPFNARDVLACMKDDATLLCVFISDVMQGKKPTPEEGAAAYKAACRCAAGAELGGVE